VFHQFKFVAETIKEPGYQSIRLPYFGKFHAKKERIAHMNEKTRKKLEKLNAK
jgi:hypothetical protein